MKKYMLQRSLTMAFLVLLSFYGYALSITVNSNITGKDGQLLIGFTEPKPSTTGPGYLIPMHRTWRRIIN